MGRRAVILLLVLIFIFTLFVRSSSAEDELDVPAGMEVINVGGVRYIAPKGSKIKESGGVVTVEGHNEYLARKLSEIEERLSAMEEDIKKLQKAKITPTDAPAPSSEEKIQVVPASGKEEKQQEEN